MALKVNAAVVELSVINQVFDRLEKGEVASGVVLDLTQILKRQAQ